LNLILQNRTLSFAIALSVLTHAVLLTVRFVSPESFRLPPTNPALEVILVNAKHNKQPLNPDALAQANLDGGGNADAGRAKSPLPDMRNIEDGDSLKASRQRVTELQEQQQRLMAQLRQAGLLKTPKASLKAQDKPRPLSGPDANESKAIARKAAEIAKSIDDQNRRPHKTYITPSVQRAEYALYYSEMRKRIENMGTLNFPQEGGKKLYGELTVSIPVFQDGTIYMKEGGPSVTSSSGNDALDRAALNIVRRSAPFGRIPPNMRLKDGDSVWVVVSRFTFTREQALEAQMRSN
jgi:periplasmic protein TonB